MGPERLHESRMEMFAQLGTEVKRYAECDGELIGDETRDHCLGAIEALAGVSSMLRAEQRRSDPQDSTSGQRTPLTTA